MNGPEGLWEPRALRLAKGAPPVVTLNRAMAMAWILALPGKPLHRIEDGAVRAVSA